MQVISFHCIFISNGSLFGDDVRPYYKGYMTGLRWGLEVAPEIIYHCNAVSVVSPQNTQSCM